MDIGDLYSEFMKKRHTVYNNEYYRGVKDFAAFLMKRQNKKRKEKKYAPKAEERKNRCK